MPRTPKTWSGRAFLWFRADARARFILGDISGAQVLFRGFSEMRDRYRGVRSCDYLKASIILEE